MNRFGFGVASILCFFFFVFFFCFFFVFFFVFHFYFFKIACNMMRYVSLHMWAY